MIQAAPVKGFVSYRRFDNEEFDGVVDRLARDLTAMFAAKTGVVRSVHRSRVHRWGADWREAIRVSVEQSAVFLPVITQRYFQTNRCSEELLVNLNPGPRLPSQVVVLLRAHNWQRTGPAGAIPYISPIR